MIHIPNSILQEDLRARHQLQTAMPYLRAGLEWGANRRRAIPIPRLPHRSWRCAPSRPPSSLLKLAAGARLKSGFIGGAEHRGVRRRSGRKAPNRRDPGGPDSSGQEAQGQRRAAPREERRSAAGELGAGVEERIDRFVNLIIILNWNWYNYFNSN
jgi:hypothetical protein